MDENQLAVDSPGVEAAAEIPSEAVESVTTEETSPVTEDKPTQMGDEGSEEPASSESTPDLTEEEKSLLSSKTNSRMQFLAKEVQRLRSLTEQNQQQPEYNPLPWMNQEKVSDEPREITQEEYEKDLTSKADALVKSRMEEYERKSQLKADAEYLEKEYPELNPESSEYDKDLTDMIVETYKKISKSNPNERLAEYATKMLYLRERGREAGKSEVTNKVIKQAATQAIPTGGDQSGRTEGSSEEELIRLRKEGKISFQEFERRVSELGNGGD